MRRVVVSVAILALVLVSAPAAAQSSVPSASVPVQAVITWTRASLPAGSWSPPVAGRPVDLAWGGQGLIMLVDSSPGRGPSLWWSRDGLTWAGPMDPIMSDRNRLTHVTASLDAFAVSGQHGRRPAIWSSIDGTTWVRSSADDLRDLADIPVERFGDRSGAPMTAYAGDRIWSSSAGRRWRERSWLRASDPAVHAQTAFPETTPLVSVLKGRDGFLAVAARAVDPALLVSTSGNGWDWAASPTVFEGDPAATAFASDGFLITVDRRQDDGTHDLAASTDGERWVAVDARGDLPTGGHPLLAMRMGSVVLATDAGIWRGEFERHPGADIPAPVAPTEGLPFGRIGADPPLRTPVDATTRTLRPDRSLRPDDVAEWGGLRLELWVPHARARPGDRLVVDVRATNVSDGPIELDCPSFRVRGDLTALYPPGRRLAGHAARLRASTLEDGFAELWFRRWDELGRHCAGASTGLTLTLRPGEWLDGQSGHIIRDPSSHQALPAGRIPISAMVDGGEWRRADGTSAGTVRVGASVAVRGPVWPWPGPVQVLDALLTDPRVALALDRSTGGWVELLAVDWLLDHDTRLAIPDGVDPADLIGFRIAVSPALEARGWASLDAIVDPWTAQVLDVAGGWASTQALAAASVIGGRRATQTCSRP